MIRKFVVFSLACVAACRAQPGGNATSSGSCSPAVTGSHNTFTITCQGLPKERADEMVRLMNKILEHQLDPQEVYSHFEQIEGEIKKFNDTHPASKTEPDFIKSLRALVLPACQAYKSQLHHMVESTNSYGRTPSQFNAYALPKFSAAIRQQFVGNPRIIELNDPEMTRLIGIVSDIDYEHVFSLKGGDGFIYFPVVRKYVLGLHDLCDWVSVDLGYRPMFGGQAEAPTTTTKKTEDFSYIGGPGGITFAQAGGGAVDQTYAELNYAYCVLDSNGRRYQSKIFEVYPSPTIRRDISTGFRTFVKETYQTMSGFGAICQVSIKREQIEQSMTTSAAAVRSRNFEIMATGWTFTDPTHPVKKSPPDTSSSSGKSWTSCFEVYGNRYYASNFFEMTPGTDAHIAMAFRKFIHQKYGEPDGDGPSFACSHGSTSRLAVLREQGRNRKLHFGANRQIIETGWAYDQLAGSQSPSTASSRPPK